MPTVTSVRAFCPLHDSPDKAILDSSIGAALEIREESSHGGHGGHGGCLKSVISGFAAGLWVLSALAWGSVRDCEAELDGISALRSAKTPLR
ncbi:MAG TPA: hypothetical protein VGY91_00495 [Chthoniobacterales bacterium]|nr:hypothetical protein [Chthoniobacterales bacterium]